MKYGEQETGGKAQGEAEGILGGMRNRWGHRAGYARMHFGQRGWLRPSVLSLLEEKPMNGMEIMNKFYEASRGWWKPSPGSIYPLLETLEAEGLVSKGSDGRYLLTRKLKTRGAMPNDQVEEMLTNVEGTLSYFEDMAKSDRNELSKYRSRLLKISARLSKLK